MKRKRYTEEQIALALRQHESGTPVSEIVRKLGLAEQTVYRCKKNDGLEVAEFRRLKQVEDENRKRKQLVADLSLEKRCCRTSCQKRSEFRSKASFGG